MTMMCNFLKMNRLIFIGRCIAFAVLVLGVVHDVVTFTPLVREGLGCLSADSLSAMTYMSLMCGASLILGGWLLIILFGRWVRFPFLGLPILIISIFLCINGLLSVFYMADNLFAWLNFVLGLMMFVVVIELNWRLRLVG